MHSLLILTSITSALAVATPRQPNPPSGDACSIASGAILESSKSDPTAAILPSLAQACLHAVSVDVERDLALISYVRPFIEWQSTIEILADPPHDYLVPAIDIFYELDRIEQNLKTGFYSKQWDFSTDFMGITLSAADGHFAMIPNILGSFLFLPGYKFISVSSDGLSLPEIYLDQDAASQEKGYNASAVDTVDGLPVEEFLDSAFHPWGYQDPDALYNEIFLDPSSRVFQDLSLLTVAFTFDIPDKSEIVFKNGSTIALANVAVPSPGIPWSDVVSAEALHGFVEVPRPLDRAGGTPTVPQQPRRLLYPNYPSGGISVFRDIIWGYLSDSGDDVAVLYVSTFKDKLAGASPLLEFQAGMASFKRLCKESRKTKLIIDLSDNPGGLTVLAEQLYRELFPTSSDKIPDLSRFRAHPGLDILGQAAYGKSENFTASIGSEDQEGKIFDNWDQVFGPDVVHRQNVTRPIKLIPTGLILDATDADVPVFTPENIIVLTNGRCSSACPAFGGFLTRGHGVRTVALGGRPLNLPMQAFGGTKGTEVHTFEDIQVEIVAPALEVAGPFPPEMQSLLPSLEPPPLNLMHAAINTRSTYQKDNGGEGDLPLQFVYEAANCKLFYTFEMTMTATAIWERVADIAWHGGKCVPGSTVNEDGTIGDGTLPFDEKIKG